MASWDTGELWGPTTQEDVTDFQTAAGGHPRNNALVVYQEFDRESVCGDYVFRKLRPGCPDSATMETDLSMSGNDLVGANVVQASQLEVQDELKAGNFRIDNELSVGTSVTVEGSFSVPDRLTFTGDARFTGTVDADVVNVTQGLEADSATIANNLDAGGTVSAASATVTGDVTASAGTVTARTAIIADQVDVSGGSVSAGTANISGDLNAGTVTAASGTIQGGLVAGSVQAGSITAAGNVNAAGVDATGSVTGGTGSFNFLAVGSCSGC